MGMGRFWPALLVMVAAVVLIAPVWAVDLPAMPDLPAHVACFYLLAGGIKDPHLAHFYRLDWQFVPNLASEISVPLLSHVMGLVPATKLFLSAAVALWVLGAAAIQRALFGRVGVAPLLAAFFAYNANFFWGFLNYDFTAGLDLLVFAGWIATREMAARSAARALHRRRDGRLFLPSLRGSRAASDDRLLRARRARPRQGDLLAAHAGARGRHGRAGPSLRARLRGSEAQSRRRQPSRIQSARHMGRSIGRGVPDALRRAGLHHSRAAWGFSGASASGAAGSSCIRRCAPWSSCCSPVSSSCRNGRWADGASICACRRFWVLSRFPPSSFAWSHAGKLRWPPPPWRRSHSARPARAATGPIMIANTRNSAAH